MVGHPFPERKVAGSSPVILVFCMSFGCVDEEPNKSFRGCVLY